MDSQSWMTRGPTSPAHDFFEVFFQATDVAAAFWQPYAKGLGRWQLEMAQLGAKQTRAVMELSQKVAKAQQSGGLVEAYRDYWDQVTDFYSEANRNIATAFVRAAPHAAVLQLPINPRPSHDKLELVDDALAHNTTYERQVA